MWKKTHYQYKCEGLSCYVFQYILLHAICNIWVIVSLNSNDSTHVYMLIFQELWKKPHLIIQI